jgi:uncharacterized protein YuzE
MELHCHSETDSLYITLNGDRWSVESEEVAPGVVLDFDRDGKVVGIDMDRASKILDLTKLVTNSVPLERRSPTA